MKPRRRWRARALKRKAKAVNKESAGQTLTRPKVKTEPVDSADEAYQRALRYLELRARSAAEVKNYLRQLGVPGSVVEPTLAKLSRLNYINDEAFARNWALSRAQHQGYGPGKIDLELRKKGVVDKVIRAVVEELFAQENEEARARKLLEKRFAGEMLQEPRMVRRAVGFLLRRGYSAKVISTLLHYSIDDNC